MVRSDLGPQKESCRMSQPKKIRLVLEFSLQGDLGRDSRQALGLHAWVSVT